MWGIFLESVVIFKNYMGFHEGGFLAVIYLLVLLYLWIAEKERTRRVIFVYVPTLLLILFFCPVFRKLFVAALDDSETYYRLLWLLQMSLVSAYGLVKLWRKHAKIGLVLTCVAVICAGNYVYDSEHITKAENAYHIPQVAVEVAELISPEDYYNAMYEAMEEAQVIDTDEFVKLTRENLCNYVVLKEDRAIDEPLTDYGFEEYGRVAEYRIYRDTTME